MARIRKEEKREAPALSTSSLPDIIFMLLFFFMAVTSMKEVTFKVKVSSPTASELQKLENKSLIRYIYVGKPMEEYKKSYGGETRIQLGDAFADITELEEYVVRERSAMKEEDQNGMVISIKADKDTRMGVISDIKQSLRRAYALRLNYSASQRASY